MVHTPHGEEDIPDTCASDCVRYFSATEEILLDFERFPISDELIEEAIQYVGIINSILANGEVHGISEDQVRLLIAYVRGNNEFHEFHKFPSSALSREQQLWLYFYLEYRNPSPNYEEFVGPPTSEQVAFLLEDTPEKVEAEWQKIKDKIQAKGLLPKNSTDSN